MKFSNCNILIFIALFHTVELKFYNLLLDCPQLKILYMINKLLQ